MKKYFGALLLASQCFNTIGADQQLMQDEIKHVVILMLENRSFDNVFGWLYGEQDPPANFIPADADTPFLGLSEDKLEQYTNVLQNSKGEIVFSCPPIKGLPSVQNTRLVNSPKFDPNEPFANVHTQIFNGGSLPTMSGFLQDYATLWMEDEWLDQKSDICAVMETYTQKELPLLHGLAKHYAVSDYYFSSVPTQTNPNRAFSLCGSSDGQINNGFLGRSIFTSDSLWNRLYEQTPDTTWMVFWQTDFIPFIFPGPMSGTNIFPSVYRIPNWSQHFKKLNEFHSMARKGALPDISYLEPQWTLSINLSPKENEIFNAIYHAQEAIFGFQGNDCHPPGDVRTAENLVANVYTSLISNQEAWEKTLFIILFDEHGGLFDHVPPPAATPPDQNNQEGFNFDRYGVRVPAIFISPRIAKSTVVRSEDNNIPFDHTSLIATLMKWKNVDPSKWNMGNRVAIAPTFDSVITLKTPRTDIVIPESDGNSADQNESFADPNEMPVIQMGERFYIKDKDGNYLAKPKPLMPHTPFVGPKEDRIAYRFIGGAGNTTVGSFALLECCDDSLNNSNLLETSLTNIDCTFNSNTQMPNQWWSIKKADDAPIGSDIRYGDKVYIENHTYLDLTVYVPCRLSQEDGLFGTYVTALPITDSGADSEYWILEKE